MTAALTLETEASGLKDWALLKSFWPYLKTEKKTLWMCGALVLLTTVAQVCQPFIIQGAIDGPVTYKRLDLLWIYAAGFLALMGLHYVMRYHLMLQSEQMAQRVIYRLQSDLYRHLQTLSPRFYQRTPIGKLVTRLTSDVVNLNEMIASGGIMLIRDSIAIIGAIIAMMVLSMHLALIVLAIAPVIILTVEVIRRLSRRAYDEIRVKMARINAYLQENFSGIEIIQLYRRERKNIQTFEELNTDNLGSNLNSVLFDSSLSAAVEFLTFVILIFVLWLGGVSLQEGIISYGLLAAFFHLIQMATEPIEDLTEKYNIIQSGLSSLDKITALLREKPEQEITTLSETEATPEKFRGHIVFDRVSFSYEPGQPVLHETSFEIHPGEKIALVGPTGAGKTTLIKLLTRFYNVGDGKISVDGTDIRDVSLSALRKNMVAIQQDDFLFSRSIAENITLDMSEETKNNREKIKDALKTAQAWDWVSSLPQGIETLLLEGGKNLSSGQRQLLLFARAFYHDPPMLILDEATATMDPHTEKQVQEALTLLLKNRTAILIAHRLSTLTLADRIFMVSGGAIAESGSHEELMAHKGLYYRFQQYQAALAQAGLPAV